MQAPSHSDQQKTPTTAAKRIATASTKAHTNPAARRDQSTKSSKGTRTGAPVNDNVIVEEAEDSVTCSPSAQGPARGSVEATHRCKIATTCSNAPAVVAIGIREYRTSRLPMIARKLLEGCPPTRADIKQGGTPADASISHGAKKNRGDAQSTVHWGSPRRPSESQQRHPKETKRHRKHTPTDTGGRDNQPALSPGHRWGVVFGQLQLKRQKVSPKKDNQKGAEGEQRAPGATQRARKEAPECNKPSTIRALYN